MINKDIIKIADFYGHKNQLNQTIEELAELVQIICKLKRFYGEGQPTKAKYEVLVDNLAEEIADVGIMLEQLKYLFAGEKEVEEIKDFKIKRQLKVIDNEI